MYIRYIDAAVKLYIKKNINWLLKQTKYYRS